MQRIQFEKGYQRKFFKKVIKELNAPSLRELLRFGIASKYSTLKNYYNESRTIPKNLFEELCTLAKLDKTKIRKTTLDKNWGKQKGGKISKRKS